MHLILFQPTSPELIALHLSLILSTNRQCLGFTAEGFDQGDSLLTQAPKIGKANIPIPRAQDLFGGKLILEFSDGQQKIATFSIVGRNGFAARATF